jgi:hypothetical protein
LPIIVCLNKRSFFFGKHSKVERIEERGRMEARIIGRSLFTIYSYLITHLGYLEAILKQGFALSRLESVWVTLRPLALMVINLIIIFLVLRFSLQNR